MADNATPGHADTANGILKAVSYIKNNMVRVDAVEVVHCKDCVFYRDAQDWNGNRYKACHLRADVIIQKRNPDDFCSRGERRCEDG